MDDQHVDSPAHQFLQGLDALSQGKMLVRCDHFQQSVENQSESISPKDYAKIVHFSADQVGRWNAEWLFSPVSTPDSDADCEKEAWEVAWEAASDALIGVFPALSASLNREKRLVCLRNVMEKRLEYFRGKPIEEFTSHILLRVGLPLFRLGLKSMVYFFCKRALFPPNTVGRANCGSYFKIR
jgi:hypothetical protein